MIKSNVMANSLLMQAMQSPEKLQKQIDKLTKAEEKYKQTLSDLLEMKSKKKALEEIEAKRLETDRKIKEAGAQIDAAKEAAAKIEAASREVELRVKAAHEEVMKKASIVDQAAKALEKKSEEVSAKESKIEKALEEANALKSEWESKVNNLKAQLKGII